MKKNPAGKVPVLELDDGTFLTESAAIVEYLEERFPESPMIGTDPESCAKVRMAERIVAELFPLFRLHYLHNAPSFLQAMHGFERVPEVANEVGPVIERSLAVLEGLIGDEPFLAGQKPTVADCHFFALISAGRKFDYSLPGNFPKLREWFERFGTRPSASAGGLP